MDNIIRNCFIARLCAAFALAFPGSIPGKIAAFFARIWHDSFSRKVFVGFFTKSPKLVYSKLYSILLSLNKAIFNAGQKLSPIIAQSLTVRTFKAFSSSKFVNQSAVLSFFKKLGMKRFLICIFALYLPVDVIIRDVIQIGFLSSLWDEAFMLFCILYIAFRIFSASELTKPRLTPVDGALSLFVSVRQSTVGARFASLCSGSSFSPA